MNTSQKLLRLAGPWIVFIGVSLSACSLSQRNRGLAMPRGISSQ